MVRMSDAMERLMMRDTPFDSLLRSTSSRFRKAVSQ